MVFAAVVVLSPLFFLTNVAHAAFGVSPPFVNASHLVPGSKYTQLIYLVQDQPNQDLPMKAVLQVPDHIKSWISIDQGTSFIIPQGTRQFPVQITVTVPQGEPLGVYSGDIVFTSAPSSTGQVTIALGANVAINLTVGNGVYESYSVRLISFPDIEEGWNPKVAVRFENDGNVPESFDYATFDLYDQYKTVRLAYTEKNTGFPTAPPFTTSDFVIEFPVDFHLGVGDYWADVNFYKDNQLIGTQETVLHVLPAGSLSSMSQFFGSLKSISWIYWAGGIAALIIIVVAIWMFVRSRKKRSKKT